MDSIKPRILGKQTMEAGLAWAFAWALAASVHAVGATIPIQDPPAAQSPDFLEDVFPFLSDNCVACHSKSTRKGGLNLETPADILKGGDSGPAAVPGKGMESLLVKASTHEDADSAMPPRDNKAKAKNLTPAQIGLLKRWIDQGAKPGKQRVREVKWQALPAHVRSILTVAVSSDGRWTACSRGTQLFIYENGTGREVFRTDAHQDQLQALAFSPDNRSLASGGFREIKLWKLEESAPTRRAQLSGSKFAVSPSGDWIAFADDASVRVLKVGEPDSSARAVDLAGPVVAMEWLEKDSALALVSAQKKLAVWKCETGAMVFSVDLPATASLVRAGAGGTVWTAGGDGSAREWNATTGALVRELKGVPADVRSLSVSGNRIAVGCASGSVLIWNGEGDQPKGSWKAPSAIVDLALPAQGAGEKIAVAGADNTVRVFDWSGKVVSSVKGDLGAQREAEAAQRRLEIEEAILAATKETLAEAQKNETNAKDRVKKSTEALPLKVKEIEPKKKALEEAQVARDAAAKKAAETEAAQKTAAESLQKAESAEDSKKQDSEAAKALQVAKTSHTAAEAAFKAASEALDAAEKKKVAAEGELERAEKARMLAEAEIPLAQTEEKNATEAVVKAKADVAAQEVVRARFVGERDTARKKADAAVAVSSVRFVSEEGPVVVGLSNGVVQLCGARSGAVVGAFGERREKGAVVHLAAHAEKITAVGADGVVWGLDTRQKWTQGAVLGNPKTAVPLRDRVLALAFSGDGNLLAASSGEPSREGDLFFWDTRDWAKEPRRMAGAHSDTILAMAFSPDGKSMVTGGADKVARIIDVEALKVKMTLEGHTHHVLGVDWSPDGRTIVTGGGDNMVKIWDALSGARKKNVDGVEKEVTAVRFIGSGSQFVAASGDGKVRVVAVNGTPARTISAATTFVNAIHAPLLGSSLASGGNDGVLRLWNVADGSKISEFGEVP